ncbi:MAG: response regulator [Casimicrobiaceae bacterium]
MNMNTDDITAEDRTPRAGSMGSAPNVKLASSSKRGGSKAPPGAERPKILFLDDEERILNALSALFRYKYQVFTATDGEQALAILRRHHVHVVVSDQRMPKMTGVEFLRQAKEVAPHTVRILLTGFSDLSAIIDSVNEGEVYRFLNKPWGNQEIQALMLDALAIATQLEWAALQDAPSTSGMVPEPTAAPEEIQTARPAILVMHDDRQVFETIRMLVGDAHPCTYAADVDASLSALEASNIAVVVSGLKVGRHDCAEMLKLLKQHHAQILTIVVADSADAENVIELINQAKIFRYVLVPCQPEKLKFFIDSAFTQFLRWERHPVLLREQVIAPPVPNVQSSASGAILARLQSLRTLLVAQSIPEK